MHRIDGSGHHDNRFTEGNPQTGAEATVVTADWLNAVQEEVAHVIENQNLPLDKDSNEQLKIAINSAIGQAVDNCKIQVAQERDDAIATAKDEMSTVMDQKIDAGLGQIKKTHVIRWFAKGYLQTGAQVIKMMTGVNGTIKSIGAFLWSGSANVTFERNSSGFKTVDFSANQWTTVECNQGVSPNNMIYLTINSVNNGPRDFTGCIVIEES